MAIFAVFIVSLYCSNLVNFFYMANEDRVVLPEPSMVRVHPAFKDLISPETFGVYTDGVNARLQMINIIPYGIYNENETPVVSRTIGDSFRNSTTKLRSLGGFYTAYEVIFIKSFEAIVGNETLRNITIDISKELDIYQINKKRLLDFDDSNSPESVTQIDIKNIWGVFVVLLVGYISSILFRIFFTTKTGLSNITMFKKTKHESVIPTVNVVAESEIAGGDMVEIELNEIHSSITI